VKAEPATLEQLLELFPPEVADLGRAADALIRSTISVGGSAVSLGWKNVRYGPRTPFRMEEIIVVLNPIRDRVNLNFGDFETLPDPDRLLEGTGKGIRHVKIRTAADLKRPGVKALLQAAGKRAGL
jgi:Domain of unknown function (DU1801)